ncbi:MAG: GreA/GreB family elongation factor [Puniceicoccales bacterium]|jgi:transcription elongation GreA/GreB family factor|nr:GreA/GreB family elongation factor [Puniceicoccales bacterium]
MAVGVAGRHTMDESAVESLVAKYPILERQRDRLAALRLGAFCFHRTFGLGEIVGYDEIASRILVNFKEKPRHSIDPIFALKHLKVLPEEHILVQFRKNSEAIQKLLRDDPAGVLQLILAHSDNLRATQAEICDVLKSILTEKEWKSWWLRAKKMAGQNSRIAEPEQKSGYYALRMEPVEQIDRLVDDVLVAKQLSKKLQSARQLLGEKDIAAQSEKIVPAYEELLRLHRAIASTGTDLNRLELLWLCEDFAAALGVDLPDDISHEETIRSIDAVADLANSLSVVQLGRFLSEISKCFPETFLSTCLLLVRSCTGRTVGCAVNFLLANGHREDLCTSLEQWLRDGSMRASLLDWVLRNRNQGKYHELLAPLIGPKLFRLALVAVDQESLRQSGTRKIPLAETISTDKVLVEEILTLDSQEIAQDLAQMLLANQGFDPLTRRSILARFIRIFPELQKLLDGKSAGAPAAKQSEETTLLVSQASLDAVKIEYEQLVTVRIPANTAAVEAAREEGDLRENSMYKMARQEQDVLLSRKAQIEKDLQRIQLVNFADVDVDKARIGSVVTLIDKKGKKERLAILGAWDSDPAKKIIAYLTPLGRSILGKKVGDTVEMEGQSPRTIFAIDRWVDVAAKR